MFRHSALHNVWDKTHYLYVCLSTPPSELNHNRAAIATCECIHLSVKTLALPIMLTLNQLSVSSHTATFSSKVASMSVSAGKFTFLTWEYVEIQFNGNQSFAKPTSFIRPAIY